jgi:hypothetical protein
MRTRVASLVGSVERRSSFLVPNRVVAAAKWWVAELVRRRRGCAVGRLGGVSVARVWRRRRRG